VMLYAGIDGFKIRRMMFYGSYRVTLIVCYATLVDYGGRDY